MNSALDNWIKLLAAAAECGSVVLLSRIATHIHEVMVRRSAHGRNIAFHETIHPEGGPVQLVSLEEKGADA